jgi:hypothetical protein
MRNRVFVFIALCPLGGCVTTMERSTTPVSANMRSAIVEAVRNTWRDPYSIRDAEISQAIQPQGYTGARRAVCIRVNARNGFGGYTGRQISCFAFDGTNIVGTTSGLPVNMATSDENNLLNWRPFLEVERIGRRS